jgi:hypothetical protein
MAYTIKATSKLANATKTSTDTTVDVYNKTTLVPTKTAITSDELAQLAANRYAASLCKVDAMGVSDWKGEFVKS